MTLNIINHRHHLRRHRCDLPRIVYAVCLLFSHLPTVDHCPAKFGLSSLIFEHAQMLFSAEVPKEPRCAQERHCSVGDAPVTDARSSTAF